MKRKKAALYDPYLDSLGGGENHSLSICKALEDAGYSIDVFWDHNFQSKIAEQFNLHFKTIQFQPNIFRNPVNEIVKLKKLHAYDVFIYVTDGSYFFSSARRNFVFAMVPQKSLFKLTALNRLKLHNYRFITNSHYTQNNLKDWGIKSSCIYPTLAEEYINADTSQPREKIILNVGRFFKSLHAKRQDVAIQTFLQLRNEIPELNDYKLILAGGLTENSQDQAYFKELQQLANGDNHIEFLPNIEYLRLMELYKKAEMYWHFAGYGVDVTNHPEQVEHLGITPLEAMAMGCLTFCYRAGGPAETIHDNQTGWLFSNADELKAKLKDVLTNAENQQRVRVQAKNFIRDNFSYTVFSKTVREVLLGE